MIKKFLRPFVSPFIQQFRAYKMQSTITQLKSHPSAQLQAVGDALDETANGIFSQEEKELFKTIETRRSTLLNVEKEISVIDYGAGPAGSVRTQQEMDEGVHVTSTVANVSKASKPIFWTTFLFKLIRKLAPVSCVELGSCVGISASYQASALKLNGQGHLVTLEGSPAVARLAEDTLNTLNLENTSVIVGPFHRTLQEVLQSAQPVDFFFNDGHHEHDAVLRYFEQSSPYLADNTVVVFDDISWSAGMRQAWNQIERDSRVGASIDLDAVGIAFLGNGFASKEKFRLVIPKHIRAAKLW